MSTRATLKSQADRAEEQAIHRRTLWASKLEAVSAREALEAIIANHDHFDLPFVLEILHHRRMVKGTGL